jgi:hypothetical protein
MNARFAALEDAGRIERVTAGRPEAERFHAIVARDVGVDGMKGLRSRRTSA